jgi:phytoene synthase
VNSQLAAAYGVCRGITRTAAKNFYYGFLVLPRRKRDALSAVYAFMRHADDICDDPALPAAEKRDKLAGLLESLRRVLNGERTDDPVLLALADAQKRFKIRPELLEQLVHGTSMDLTECTPHFSRGAQTGVAQPPSAAVLATRYRTFDELYEYCYYVASVVGLICIRIFGYRDPSAEPLAEHVGVAFQLTNIIRDVKEDASMGRVYLPEEDLARFGLSASELHNGIAPAQLRPVLEIEAQRARDFYKAADELLPLIDDDSQPALWALVQIYRRLLEKIAKRNYDVLSERVRLTVPEKLAILSQGFLRRLV